MCVCVGGWWGGGVGGRTLWRSDLRRFIDTAVVAPVAVAAYMSERQRGQSVI